jgi:excisionase family DNA binding protein
MNSINIELLTTKEVAALLGVKSTKVYQLMKYKNLPYGKVGRAYRFIKSSILQWKEDYEKSEADFADSANIYKVASFLRVNIATINSLVEKEGLPYHIYKPGRYDKRYFKIEEVIYWFAEKEKNKPAKLKRAEPLPCKAVPDSMSA